jgi:NADH dehydrogenase
MCTQIIDRIVVSGARGFVGKNLRKFLCKNKITSIPLSRNHFKKNQFPSLKNVSHFVHLAGIGSESVDQDSFVKVNIELTKTVINLCKKNSIKNIIYFSGLGVSKNSRSSYFISKFNAEQLIKKSGLQYIIFRPSYILGIDDYLTKNISKQILKKQILIPGSGNFILQPISIDDVCLCINHALHSSKFLNKTIDLVGPKKLLFQNLIKKSVSSKIKIKKINLESAYKKALNDINFEYGIEDLNILVGNYVGNHKKLQNLCNFKFKNVESLDT